VIAPDSLRHAGLSDRRAYLRHLAPLRKKKWVVYAKPPFAGPEAVLAYARQLLAVPAPAEPATLALRPALASRP
jgi:hypothetical protein